MLDVRYVDAAELGDEPYTGVHPFAEAYPLMPDGENAELAADIVVNGLLHPPVLYKGLILDGRERCRACKQAGVPITRFGVYQGGDPAGFVLSQNHARRHMSTGARAMAAARLLQAAGKRKNGRWLRGSVDGIANISNTASARQAAMRKAGVIVDHGPSFLADLVVREQWSLDNAFKHADALRRVKPERSAEAQAEYEAAFRAYHECAAEYEAKERELGDALAAAAATASGEEAKARARAKKSAESPSPYVELAKSIAVLASFGRSGDVDADGFDPNDMDPPVFARHYESGELDHARLGIQKFSEWRVRYDARLVND
jgi:hypothetical protein